MPAYVIYARKSSESEDRQALSIESQIKELKQIAARRGVAVSEVLSEAHSAKAPGRPVFGELMRRVRRGDISGILCWKMDRLARNHLDHGAVLQALADGALKRVITSDRAYTGDGNDRFIGNFELGMATKYIDDLRANVLRGNRERFERGWVNHNPPLGYLLDPTTKTIIKDPKRFALVRRMWDLLLMGSMRPERIRRIANERWGLRSRKYKRMGGNPLGTTTVYGIFANPFYMGLIKLMDGRTYPGAHAPMISQEEFDRAQEVLGRPMRPRPQRHEFPFTGLMRCGNCGGSITAEVHVKKSGLRFVYYRCTRRVKATPCREPAIAAPRLVEHFADLLSVGSQNLGTPER
jgi:DNA invertase Pin-like site-specific DNA recombinase